MQAGATGTRRVTCLYYAGSSLAGWTDAAFPYDPAGTCPTTLPASSHATRLAYSNGRITSVTKTQTYTTLASGTLGTDTRIVTTAIAYSGADVASVTDAEGGATQFTHVPTDTAIRALGQTQVVRPGTPASTTVYTLASPADTLGRTTSVKRKLGAAWIEERTAHDATYPVEPASVTENYVNGVASDTAPDEDRITSYTYVAYSMGLVAQVTEPLTASTHRTTAYTYNANNDVTQTITALDGSATVRTVTRHCYDATCSLTGAGLVMLKTIENHTDGTAGNGKANVEDVTTTYEYDTACAGGATCGQRTRQTRFNYTEAGGPPLDQVYDPACSCLRPAATRWTYDTYGNQTSEIRNVIDGAVTSPGDDITPNASTGARTDLTTVFGYDTAGNRVSVADPRRAIEVAKGTSLGPDDYITRSTYDPLGQQVNDKTPTTPGVTIAQRTATTEYDEVGLVRESVDFGGVVTATEYDRTGHATRTFEDTDGTGTTAAAVTSASTYDAAGRALTFKDRLQVAPGSTLGATATTYDELNRAVTVTEAWTSPITPLATITATVYDDLGRTILEETGAGDPYGTGQQTLSAYDLGGRTTRTDDEFACTSRTYDWRDLMLTETTGLLGGTCTSSPDTREVTNTHDALGRLVESEVTAGPGDNDILEASTYDAAGRQRTTSATASGVTTASSLSLNPLDETLAETRSTGGTATSWTRTTYDPAGNAADRCTWASDPGTAACLPVGQGIIPAPSVRSTTTYDARNNRVSLDDGATSTTTVYDPAHNYAVKAFYVPTGSGKELQTLYEYDPRHRIDDPATMQTPGIGHQLCTLNADTPDQHDCSSTTPLGSDRYVHDDNDNRTQVVEDNGATSSDRRYCYDGLNRLRARNTGSPCTLTTGDELYTFDDAGNRLTAPGASATYDPAGQLLTCTGCGTVAHDDAGRITALAGWTYGFDAEGRMTSATETASGDRLDMAYDAEGHRTRITTTENKPDPTPDVVTVRDLRYQGDAIVEESVNGTVVRSYTVTEAGQVVSMTIPAGQAGAGTYLPTWNGHGDALSLWKRNDADGTLVLANSYTYGTWGTPATAVHNSLPDLGFRFLYVGAADVQWDDFSGAGLLYMHARHYNPVTGRFLQPDPSAAEANLYSYVEANPVSAVDACGHKGVRYGRQADLCAKKYGEIARRVRVLVGRYRDQLFGDPSKTAGHLRAYRTAQAGLNEMISSYENMRCPDRLKQLPRSVYSMARRSFPSTLSSRNSAWALFLGIGGGFASLWWSLKVLSPACGPAAPVCIVAL